MHWLLAGYVWLYIHRPFEVWQVLGTIQLERLYMLGTFAFWLAYPGKRWIPNLLHHVFLAFLLLIIVCWCASPYPEQGEKVIEDYGKVCVFYLLVITSVHDEKGLRRLLGAYLVALGLYMGHSMFEYLNGKMEYRMGTTRMVGVDQSFGDPNTFAASLLHAMPFLLPFWREGRARTRWLLAGFMGLAMLCILLTGSRRAFVGLGFLVFIWMMMSRYRWRLLFLAVLLSPLGWGLLREDLQHRFLTLIDSSYGPENAQGSAQFRYTSFWDGVRLWSENPLTGVGPEAFGKAIGHNMQAHNLYGQTLGELGTLGLAALVLMVVGFCLNARAAARLRRQRPGSPRDFPYEVVQAGLLAMVLLLFMGMGGHNLYRYNWMWFGAIQAIALHCVRTRAALPDPMTRRLPYLRGPRPSPWARPRLAPGADGL